MKKAGRCYRHVRTCELASGQWHIMLDEKAAKTPAGNPLILPAKALADAIADEWRSQPKEMRLESMKLTRLANTAIDRISRNRHDAVAELLNIAATDLLRFRAPGPQALLQRQSAVWDPLLDWARERYQVQLGTSHDLVPAANDSGDMAGLESALLLLDDFSLTALVCAANIMGSAVLALALSAGRLDSDQAFEAAELDSIYQVELWGEDPEVVSRNLSKLYEVSIIAKFLALNTAV
jgi:chaperone required for assembly of F1-ATPase